MSNNTLGAFMEEELVSQPEVWKRAIEQCEREQAKAGHLLPADGERIAVVGCGTSWFMAQSYAAAREAAGKGVTDAFAASEAFLNTTAGPPLRRRHRHHPLRHHHRGA